MSHVLAGPVVGFALAAAAIFVSPRPLGATPITVGGFTFADGETAFADDAFLVSGSGVRFSCTAGGVSASSLGQALSGSDVTQCANVSGGGDGILEVQFTDNSITNGAGTDLVVFEVSGPQSPGTPDLRERFEVSVFDGEGFSAFVAFDPVATGFGTPDPTLDIFAVQVDLSAFGLAPGSLVDRVRLHLFDNNQGSKGADIAALGALNSGEPVPEPSSGPLLLGGLVAFSLLSQRHPGKRSANATLSTAAQGIQGCPRQSSRRSDLASEATSESSSKRRRSSATTTTARGSATRSARTICCSATTMAHSQPSSGST